MSGVRFVVAALVVAACTGTPTSAAPNSSAATPATTQAAASPSASVAVSETALDLCAQERVACELPPGMYRPSRFRPAVTFVLPTGWTGQRHFADGFALTSTDPPVAITFASGVSSARDRTIGKAVADVAGYLQKAAGLRPSAPSPAQLGGASGIQLDVVAAADAQDLFLIEKDAYNLAAGQKARFWIVDVGGVTVIAIVESNGEAAFEAAIAAAQPVLDSVKFE